MTQQDQKQLLYRKLNALRLEVHESIVDDIKQTVDALFAPAPAQENNFYCKEWNNVGYHCEGQCDACAKTEKFEIAAPAQGVEEAAKAYANKMFLFDDLHEDSKWQAEVNAFIAGSRWQQGQ